MRDCAIGFGGVLCEPQMSHSLFTSLLAAVDDDDEFVEKKRRIERCIDESQAYPDSTSMFPVLGSQQGFVPYGTEASPVFPGLNPWSPQPVGNPYQYCCFPYNNICLSSTPAPNLKQNVEEAWKSYNPQQMESLIDNITVLPSGYVPFQAMFQNPFFSAPVREPSLNYSLSSSVAKSQELDVCSTSRGSQDNYPIAPKPVRGHILNFSPYAPLTQNELNVCATSQGPADENTLDGSALVSEHKRKMGSPSYLSNISTTTPLEANNKAKLEPSGRHVIPSWLEHNAPEATQNTKPPPVTASAELQSKYSTAANICVLEEEQDAEGKDFLLLLQKELRNTDVGNLGRIVLPKKDAEANLPSLEAKNGLFLQMEDMTLSIKWRFKYRYWPNNKSRMYVMENTGDFVRTHNLQTGDFFIVYRERNSGKFIACGMKGAVGR